MKDDTSTEPTEVSRQDLYEDYKNWYLQQCLETRLCRDERLLKKAAQFLLKEPEVKATFTVFPFNQAVTEPSEALSDDCRSHLSALIKATELLETLCVNLFLQPWKKEFKTLKTFTGPFVYFLLPVLSSSTIESVLASIGYLPHSDAPHSEFRLSEDANPDRAILVGFELLLARVECYQLLKLQDELGPEEWLDVLHRRVGPTKPEEPTEKKTTTTTTTSEQKEEEEKTDWGEEPMYLDTRLTVSPLPKPQNRRVTSAFQSIVEMQRTYPDLAFRGRPLVADKPHQPNSSSKADDQAVSSAQKRQASKHRKATSYQQITETESYRSSGDRNSDGTITTPNTAGYSITDGGRVNEELSGPQAISLHITLRAAEQEVDPGESQPASGTVLPSMSSVDEEQQLRELAERMGQLHVQETPKEEVKSKGENKRQESMNQERRKKEKKTNVEGEAEELNIRKPVMETGPVGSRHSSRCTFQPDSAAMRHPRWHKTTRGSTRDAVLQNVQRPEGGDDDGAQTGRVEEDQSFVIL